MESWPIQLERLVIVGQSSLSGNIPSEICLLSKLKELDLSLNNLTGIIPLTIGNLTNLTSLNLSYNQLSGLIPSTLGNSTHLTTLDLHSNQLNGSTPPQLMNCSKLQTLRLGNNQLSGSIPSLIGALSKLKELDLLSNDLTGGYGSVYRAHLPSGKVVALKKLHSSETDELAYLQSFHNEARLLSQIRHRNIVKLYGYCLHKKCMFLIYEYMEMGSLFCVLRNDDEAVELDWTKRVNIVKGVAYALSHLHHNCTLPIVHRDI